MYYVLAGMETFVWVVILKPHVSSCNRKRLGEGGGGGGWGWPGNEASSTLE